jgi:hypothetical protein
MRFTGADALAWPLAASNNSVNQWGFAGWFKPDAVAVTRMLWFCFTGSGAASLNRVQLYFNVTQVVGQAYINNTAGRFGQTALGLVNTGWQFLTFEYDGGGATEPEKLVITLAGIARTLTFANLGSGGTLGALPAPTGNGLIGAAAASANPYQGLIGPNLYVLNAKMAAATTGLLTPQARLDLMSYDQPT